MPSKDSDKPAYLPILPETSLNIILVDYGPNLFFFKRTVKAVSRLYECASKPESSLCKYKYRSEGTVRTLWLNFLLKFTCKRFNSLRDESTRCVF